MACFGYLIDLSISIILIIVTAASGYRCIENIYVGG